MRTNEVRQRMDEQPDDVEAIEAEMASELGDQVRKLREQAGMSKVQLAALMETSVPMIIRLENGTGVPTIGKLVRVAAALNTTLSLHVNAKGIEVNLEEKPTKKRVRAAGSASEAWGRQVQTR
jgi:transcriptional regulator with XRE-family HTH domain